MAHGMWRFISTTCVPCGQDSEFCVGDTHPKHGRLDHLTLDAWRLFFYVFRGADRGDGEIRIIAADGTRIIGHSGPYFGLTGLDGP